MGHEISIIRPDREPLVLAVDDSSYRRREIMGEDELVLNFSLAVYEEIPAGSTVTFEGDTYTLFQSCRVDKRGSRNFEYQATFNADYAYLRKYMFYNWVDKRLSFDLTARPWEHIQMIVDNLNDRLQSGDMPWRLGEGCIESAEKLISYSCNNCMEALQAVADTFETEWEVKGRTIFLRKVEYNADSPLELSYGRGNGLRAGIQRTAYNDETPAARVYIQGGERNIFLSEYGSRELKLPKSAGMGYDGEKYEGEDGYDNTKGVRYVTDDLGQSVAREGGPVNGGDDVALDLTHIYPSHTCEVESVEYLYKSGTYYSIDELVAAYPELADENAEGWDNVQVDVIVKEDAYLPDYSASELQVPGETRQVVFQSGNLASREFDINDYKHEERRFKLVSEWVDGFRMPAGPVYHPAAGNTFIVAGVSLPSEYVSEAEDKALREAVKYLYEHEAQKVTINAEIDPIQAARMWDSWGPKIILGGFVRLTDDDLLAEVSDIRIKAVKQYVNTPTKPVVELSNSTASVSFGTTIRELENQEVHTDELHKDSIQFSKRRWREAKETISMLQGALDNFTEGISPITVETMSMLVGDERLQYVFTRTIDSDDPASLEYSYNPEDGVFTVSEAFIKHMTLGIDSISPVHSEDEYLRWHVAGLASESLDKESGYYLYAKVSKESMQGVFVLSDHALKIDSDEGYYNLLVGILNAEFDGERSFASMYGFAEILPGQITTDTIKSVDGKTWLDLLRGILHLNDNAGVSGAVAVEKGDKSIAAWFGGLMEDLEFDDNPSNPANTLFRHDGSGYLAKGNIKFNEKGEVELSPNIKISGTGDETLDSILTMLAVLNDMFYFADDETIGTKYNFFSEKENSAGGKGESIGPSGGGGDVDLTGYATEEWVLAQNALLEERIEVLEQGGGAVNVDGSEFVNVDEDGTISLEIDPQGGLGATEQGLGIVDIPSHLLEDIKIDVDSSMSDTSENAVANKVIKKYVDGLEASVNQTFDDIETSIEQLDSAVSELIATKAGAFYLNPTDNMFTVFTTVEARDKYLTDPTSTEGILYQQVIQGGGGGASSNSYAMKVTIPESQYNYTTASEKMMITATFESTVKYAGSDSYEPLADDAIFTVEVYKAGADSSKIVATGIVVPYGGQFSFDLKPYLGNGSNTVILRVVGLVYGATAVGRTNVSVTTMSLAPFGFEWYKPFVEGSDYTVSLRVLGSLSKTLYVQIGDNAPVTTSLGTNQYDVIPLDHKIAASYHPSASGVYELKMWLKADVSGVTSEVLKYNIMCVASEDVATRQLVCINEVATEVDNYAEGKLFAYATYNGRSSKATPTLSITKGSETVTSNTIEVETGVPYDFSYAFSLAMAETSAAIVAKAVFGNTQTAQITLKNETAFAPVSGYSFYMDAASRSNEDEHRESFVNEVDGSRIAATWTDMAWVNGMDGWTTDENGNKCLLIPAMSKALVDFAPMKSIASAMTLEMQFKVKNVSDFDEDIITIASQATASWMGVKVKPTNVTMHSRSLFTDDLKQGYNLKDEEMVHLVVCVNNNFMQTGNVVFIYVNGVKKCTFEWSRGDSFNHEGKLELGSQTADLYLYKIRLYEMQFEWAQILQNYISCLPTPSEKSQTKRKEDSVVTDTSIDFDKVYGKYNTFIVELPSGAELPNRKNNPSNIPIEGTNLYIDIVQDRNCTIQGEFLNVPLEGQGTTAMTYYRWNLRSKTDTIRITAKKNVASSMHSHKPGATRLFNDLNRAIVGANEADGRVAVYQYPVYGFLKIENEDQAGTYYYEFIGLYTIGPDKGDKPTFGYDNKTYKSTLIHMEGTDHDKVGVGMDYPWEQMTVGLNIDGDAFIGPKNSLGQLGDESWEIGACGGLEDPAEMKAYLDVEFAPAYKLDYDCTPLIYGLPSGITIADVNANIKEFRELETDTEFTCAACLIYIDGEYDTYYYNVVSGTYVKDGRKVYDGLTSAHGFSTSTLESKGDVLAKNAYIRECRKARYRAEMGQYWHLNDNIFHACFLDLIGATDNEKKNSYPYKFGTLASGSRWRWRQDDLDTIFDVNNQGSADKSYSIMNTDKQGTTMIFKGNTSYHWRCVREYYKEEMKTMMQSIFAQMIAMSPYGTSDIQKLVGCIHHYFWDYAQEYFTGGAYNLDAKWTYEDTWRLYTSDKTINAVNPLNQSLGSHYEAEKAWVALRMLFLASMYESAAFVNYVDSSEGQISFRQGGDFTFNLTPAIDLRPSIIQGQSKTGAKFADGRIMAGDTATINTVADDSADTMVYVQGADWLADAGDFSKVRIGSSDKTFAVSSKRLQRIKVGDATASNVTTNIGSLDVGSCPSVEEIEARNISSLQGEVDLTKCPRLRRAYFGGTSLTGITLPDGSKIQEYGLPSTIQRLKLRQLPLLQKSGLVYDELNGLTYLWVEGNKGLDGYDLLKTAFNGGSPLNNIRVIGFDKTGDASDITFLKTLANGNYHGIDSNGFNNDNVLPNISGRLYIVGTASGKDRDFLENAFDIEVDADKFVTFIEFEDPEVLRVLLANGVGDGNGITEEQAAAVTNIATWFKGNTVIKTFDELGEFVNLTSLVAQAFSGCTSLASIDLSNIASIGNEAFQNCVLTTVDLRNVTSLGIIAFKYCKSLSGTINLDKLTGKLNGGAFSNTAIGTVNAPLLDGFATNAYGVATNGCFYNCTELKSINAQKVTFIGQYAFESCGSLTTLNVDWDNMTTIESYAFRYCTSLAFDHLNLPNLTSLGQNAFYGVKIKKLSLGAVVNLPESTANTQNYGDKSVLEEVVLSDSLTAIGTYTFYQYTSLSKLNALASVTSIGASAFRSSAITELNAPVATSTRDAMCQDCNGLAYVYLPKVENIAYRAFYKCTSLETIVFGQEVTNIYQEAFLGCTKLTSVINLPKVTSISMSAFKQTAITELNAPLATSLSDQLCAESSSLVSAHLPKATIIPYRAFYKCSSLKSFEVGEDVTNIYQDAFIACSALTHLICKPTTPPQLSNSNVFNQTNNCPIYVPDASVETYKAAANWNNASIAPRIYPISISPIEWDGLVGAYTFINRTNDDANRDIVPDRSGNGNFMTLYNMNYGYENPNYDFIKEGYFNDKLYFRSTYFGGNSYGKIEMNTPLEEVTVIMKRSTVYDLNTNVMRSGTSAVGSGETQAANIFSLERFNGSAISNEVEGLSVAGRNSDEIVWMNSTHYCGKKMSGTKQDKVHDGVIYINRDRGDLTGLGRGAMIDGIFIFNRSLSPTEIEEFIHKYIDSSYTLPEIEA